jgi:hypothetical protein
MLLLRDRPGARLKIKGHVASAKDQPARVLKRLARERAQVVRDLLVARGVSPKRLKVVAATELDIDEIEILVSGSTKVVKAKPPKGRPAAESAQVAEPPAQEQSAAALEPKAPPAPASPAPEPKASPVPASPAPAPKANE